MIKADNIIVAQNELIKWWGDAGKRVIEETHKITPFNGTAKDFLEYCTACGGNWGGMLLSGVQKLYPNVWEVIPDDMGAFAWAAICNTVMLCGVDTSE